MDAAAAATEAAAMAAAAAVKTVATTPYTDQKPGTPGRHVAVVRSARSMCGVSSQR